MPAKSKKQQQMMGAELARLRAGKKTKTGMSEKQLKEFASTKTKGLPVKVTKHMMNEKEMAKRMKNIEKAKPAKKKK